MTARRRRTKAQIGQLQKQILEVLHRDHPQSVRHVFYRMTNPTLPEPVEKSERGYVTVQRQLVAMRRKGLVPYGWITDATRRGYFTTTYNHPADAIGHVATLYRRSYWASAPVYVEVWCESRSIAGVIEEDCRRFAVPLYPSAGFTSLSLAWQAAEHIRESAGLRPVHILYLGDYDAAGVLIDRSIEAELRKHLPDIDITFQRLAITPHQINLMGLPTKPAKQSDRRGGWKPDTGTVEAEAMPAGIMRELLCESIEQFIDPHELAVMEAAEESERHSLHRLAEDIRAA
jgi:hypothetical protein